MKISKSKGFTLIELLVVISIIGLLSSVVLASLKGAREKAVLTKLVSEMKSLQTAIEMYRNQSGVYPGEIAFYNDDDNSYVEYNEGSLEIVFLRLIDNKFISKIPHAPNYPNNCTVDYQNCIENGYILNYFKPSGLWSTVYCGRQRVENYILYVMVNNKKISLPLMEQYIDGLGYVPYGSANYYCLTM